MPASPSMKPTPAKHLIYIPAIVMAELYYLNEKKGRPLDFRTKYARLTQSKSIELVWLKVNPIFDGMRSDPHFADSE